MLFVKAGVKNDDRETIADVSTDEFVRVMVTNALTQQIRLHLEVLDDRLDDDLAPTEISDLSGRVNASQRVLPVARRRLLSRDQTVQAGRNDTHRAIKAVRADVQHCHAIPGRREGLRYAAAHRSGANHTDVCQLPQHTAAL